MDFISLRKAYLVKLHEKQKIKACRSNELGLSESYIEKALEECLLAAEETQVRLDRVVSGSSIHIHVTIRAGQPKQRMMMLSYSASKPGQTVGTVMSNILHTANLMTDQDAFEKEYWNAIYDISRKKLRDVFNSIPKETLLEQRSKNKADAKENRITYFKNSLREASTGLLREGGTYEELQTLVSEVLVEFVTTR